MAVNNFVLRTLSGLVLLVLVVGSILYSHITMAALAVVIAAFSLHEFYTIISSERCRPASVYSTLVGVLTVVLFYLSISMQAPVLISFLVPLYMLLFFIELFRKQEQPFINIALSLGGLIYIALPLGLFTYLPFIEGSTQGYNPWVLLGVIFTVWGNDVGAYLVGVSIGRHKMFPRLSPKKSWEGFVGGVFFAILTSSLVAYFAGFDICKWAVLGLIISLTSVLGDLVESMLKRSLGIKDSGNSIPGHGGFLDRFDALILTIPFVYIYFIIFTV
ncbi:MAG: phosphatidate cytidylyltransferase [Rikenellaceae bacterium]